MKNFLFLWVLIFLCSGEVISQKSLILQPNEKEGKDAVIWNISSKHTYHGDVANKNYGSEKEFKALAWTFNGSFGEKRSLIEFNLKKLPKNAQIISAYLSLYAAERTEDANKKGHYYSFSKSNECILQRIVEPWDEYQVTWNSQPKTTKENEVIVHKSDYSYQNYENIDVTQLIKDMLKDSENNFGFMFSVKVPDYYRCLIFASSDYPKPELHPKLVINYTTKKKDYFHFNKKHSDKNSRKYIFIVYNEQGEEIKRIKGKEIQKFSELKPGTYHFNLTENSHIISAGKFIIY